MADLFTLNDSLFEIYRAGIDALIDQIGKNVKLVYPPKLTACANCYYDSIGRKSANVYRSGGPAPFVNGALCPVCMGQGKIESSYTETIKMLVNLTPSNYETYDLSLRTGRSVASTKCHASDLPKIKRCIEAILDSDNEAFVRQRAILSSTPILSGLKDSVYCTAYWDIVDINAVGYVGAFVPSVSGSKVYGVSMYVGGTDPFTSDSSNINLYTSGPVPSSSGINLFVNSSVSTTNALATLFVDGHTFVPNNIDMFVDGHMLDSSGMDLFTQGSIPENGSSTLYTNGHIPVTAFIDMFLDGHTPDSGSADMFTEGMILDNSSATLFINSHMLASGNVDMSINGHFVGSGSMGMFIDGIGVGAGFSTLFIRQGAGTLESSNITLYTSGLANASGDQTMFVEGHNPSSGSMDMFIGGLTSDSTSTTLFMDSHIPASGSMSLFTEGLISDSTLTTLFINSHIPTSGNIDMFTSGYSPSSGNMNLFIQGLITESSSHTLFTEGHSLSSGNMTMFTSGLDVGSGAMDLYISGIGAGGISDASGIMTLVLGGLAQYDTFIDNYVFESGTDPGWSKSGGESYPWKIYPYSVLPSTQFTSMFIGGHSVASGNISMFIEGPSSGVSSSTSNLFTHGLGLYDNFIVDYGFDNETGWVEAGALIYEWEIYPQTPAGSGEYFFVLE